MTQVNLGTPPGGTDGDTVREGFTKVNPLLVQQLAADFNNWATLQDVVDALISLTILSPIVGPLAPENLLITPVSGSLDLSWDASAGADSYDVYRGLSSGSESFIVSGIVTTSYSDASAIGNTNYFYKVTAVNVAGESSFSNEVTALSYPGAPTDLTTTPGVTDITLDWVHAAGNCASFQIWRGFSSGTETLLALGVSNAATSYVDSTAVSGTLYYYLVKAINVSGATSSNEAVGRIGEPDTPTNPEAFGTTGGVFIQWDAMPTAITYDLQTSPDGTSWSNFSMAQVGTTASDPTGHAHYRVRATNTVGSSAYQANPGFAPDSPLLNPLTWLRCVNGFTAATWSDQSGNGNNATQATGGNQFAASGLLGAKTVVTAVDSNRIMNLPDILPTLASWTFAILFKADSSDVFGNLWSGRAQTGNAYLTVSDGSVIQSNVFSDSGTNLIIFETENPPLTRWNLLFYTLNGTPANFNPAFSMNGVMAGIGATGGPYTATQPHISIGGVQSSGGFGFIGSYAEFELSSSAAGIDEINNFTNMVNATYGTATGTFAKQAMLLGDSITAGAQGQWGGGSWAFLLSASDPSKYLINKGWSSSQVTDFIGVASTYIYPCLSRTKQTTCTVAFGVNDLRIGGLTGAQIYANMVTLVTNIRNNNPGGVLKFVGITPTPCGASFETQRQALSNLMVADPSDIFDATVDVRTIPMGAPGANTNLTYYNPDQVHPNDTGHADMEAIIEPIISPIW